MNRTSSVLESILNEDLVKARQVGDSKVGSDGITRYWTEIKPGKFDWRKGKPQQGKKQITGTTGNVAGKGDGNKVQKLRAFLLTQDSDKVKTFAKNPNNDPTLRQEAYDELVKRGEDVSDINLNTGKFKKMKEMFGTGTANKKTKQVVDTDADDTSGDGESNALDGIDGDVEEGKEWTNPTYIKKKFGGLKTKQQRIDADAFIHKMKTSDPDYEEPQQHIFNLNKTYAQFFRTDSPLMIASGGAGVGKTFNMHMIAEHLGKKAFNPETDEPGDSDYDYVEAPEITSPVQLAQILKEHNGKIIVFDDADEVLKKDETMGIMKKATASSGKRIVGKKSTNKNANIDPFEFTGKILFLTNMDQHDLTADEHINAVYTRALKQDIQFTKSEKLDMMEHLKHKMNFTGVPRLENKADDVAERDAVFDLIKKNIGKMDPAKFSSRTFKEALEIKRSIDNANELIEADPTTARLLFGDVKEWEPEVAKFLTKGRKEDERNELMKALSHLDLM